MFIYFFYGLSEGEGGGGGDFSLLKKLMIMLFFLAQSYNLSNNFKFIF